jgi:hypothetical protein
MFLIVDLLGRHVLVLERAVRSTPEG